MWASPADVEAARDLARARDDSTRALKTANQQLLAFLLRQGAVWDEHTRTGRVKKAWGADFTRWLAGGILPPDISMSICGISYLVRNPIVVKVTRKGVIKAKRVGRCNVCAYGENGVWKKFVVTVVKKGKRK